MNPDLIAMGLLWYVVFLFSTTCHEAAHALVAKWGGDLTAAQGGQVTLNPWPHIKREPFGMVVVPLLSSVLNGWPLGWASAPYDPKWSRMYPRRAAKMALAGPAANFLLAVLAAIVIQIGLHTQFFVAPDDITFSHVVDAATRGGLEEALARFVGLVFSLNVLLGTFNLMPVPPLDGFNVLPIFMSESGGQRYLSWADSVRAYSLIGLVISWQIFGKIFWPVFEVALRSLYR